MKSIITLFIAMAAVSASSAGAVVPRDVKASAERVRDAVIAASPELPSQAARSLSYALGLEPFHPAVITIQRNGQAGWDEDCTITMAYDAQGRVVRSATALPVSTGAAESVTEYSYASDTAILPDTITETYPGWESQTAIAYDSRVTHFPVRIYSRYRYAGQWSPWTMTQSIEVTRDAAGRVTAVSPRLLSRDFMVGDIDPDYEEMTITYGADGNPSAIVSRSAEYDYETGRLEYDEPVTLSDLRWDSCDGQILSLSMLYQGANRIAAASIASIESTGRLTVAYPDDKGSYTSSFAGTEDGERVEITEKVEVLDDFGSFRKADTERYITSGYVETETQTCRYDRFGISLENIVESTSTDPTDKPHELDYHEKSAVTYSAATGEPEMVVTESLTDTGRFVPVTRTLYNGFSPSGISSVVTDATARPRSIFDLQGRPLREAVRPGLYIIDGRTTLVR